MLSAVSDVFGHRSTPFNRRECPHALHLLPWVVAGFGRFRMSYTWSIWHDAWAEVVLTNYEVVTLNGTFPSGISPLNTTDSESDVPKTPVTGACLWLFDIRHYNTVLYCLAGITWRQVKWKHSSRMYYNPFLLSNRWACAWSSCRVRRLTENVIVYHLAVYKMSFQTWSQWPPVIQEGRWVAVSPSFRNEETGSGKSCLWSPS